MISKNVLEYAKLFIHNSEFDECYLLKQFSNIKEYLINDKCIIVYGNVFNKCPYSIVFDGYFNDCFECYEEVCISNYLYIENDTLKIINVNEDVEKDIINNSLIITVSCYNSQYRIDLVNNYINNKYIDFYKFNLLGKNNNFIVTSDLLLIDLKDLLNERFN